MQENIPKERDFQKKYLLLDRFISHLNDELAKMDEVPFQINTVKTGLPAVRAIRVHEAVAEDPPRNNVRVEQQVVPGELF